MSFFYQICVVFVKELCDVLCDWCFFMLVFIFLLVGLLMIVFMFSFLVQFEGGDCVLCVLIEGVDCVFNLIVFFEECGFEVFEVLDGVEVVVCLGEYDLVLLIDDEYGEDFMMVQFVMVVFIYDGLKMVLCISIRCMCDLLNSYNCFVFLLCFMV